VQTTLTILPAQDSSAFNIALTSKQTKKTPAARAFSDGQSAHQALTGASAFAPAVLR